MTKKRLDQVLNELLIPLSVEYLVKENRIILRSNQEVGSSIPTLNVLQLGDKPIIRKVSVFENNALADITIKGTVTDEKGEKLPGVSVIVKGTTRGTNTNQDGEYTITVSDEKAVLIFSFVGNESKEISVNNQTKLNVVLLTDTKSLDEVLVTAFGIKRDQKALGYASQKVGGEQLSAVGNTNIQIPYKVKRQEYKFD